MTAPLRNDVGGTASEASGTGTFRADVIAGLGAARKSLPPKYFYDAAGSRLFDRICTLPEYYPTRTEAGILTEHAADIGRVVGRQAILVEFGAGSLVKVRTLLDALEQPAAYIPIDISEKHLIAASGELAHAYPRLKIMPVVGDFTASLTLPQVSGGRVLGFFPGSTIGNFTPEEARRFLVEAGRTLGADARLVLGVDLKKAKERLEAAYDDAAGVTAAFNLNLLSRINRELGGGFDLSRFAHRAVFNSELGRIEMHIVSLEEQSVAVAGQMFHFACGETIHTENSYKYDLPEIRALADASGWHIEDAWTGDEALFGVFLLSRS
ncbi:MAG: L-histidine N(alpha)-methyltransferase [Rhizobiales bacterium 17-65-6]|nr:MAG: L-histidine N(alpha)-methyltransferase [Azorhizobium sp. 32-67-21]OYZ99868.1 MAG: L-histidine N(alpha)-methyltransferase [Rhizobiales bacterium 17-65-6]